MPIMQPDTLNVIHAQHVKQIKGRKTDVADSVWLARICQFGLCRPSFVPPADFRALRKVSRQRYKVVHLRATLRTLLVECAHSAVRTHHCQFQGYHKALTVRRGKKRATVATAHKLLRILYRMLATGQPYRDPHTDYEALMVKRNAPRWIRRLKQHGIDPATGARRIRCMQDFATCPFRAIFTATARK